MHKGSIFTLFPTVVYKDKMEREFTNTEIDNTECLLDNLRKNVLNNISQDYHVLSSPAYAEIKKFIMKTAETYCYDVMNYNKDMKLRITQSWLNLTLENQGHHLHHHPNSFISGVLYLQCRKGDSIKFQNNTPVTIEPEIYEYNILNSYTYEIGVEAKDIVMFPSTTQHMVSCSEVKTPRISLAFNIFPSGIIGSADNLSELIL